MNKLFISTLLISISLLLFSSPIKYMIGSKQISLHNEINVKQNPYSTRNLIAMWDGEWNIGFNMHDSNSKVWVDLVEQRVLCLKNHASFGSNYMETTDFESGAVSNYLLPASAYFEIVYSCSSCPGGWYSLIDDLSGIWIWAEPSYQFYSNAHGWQLLGLQSLYWHKYISFSGYDTITNNVVSLRCAFNGTINKANDFNMIVDDYGGDDGLGAFSIFGNVDNIGEDRCCNGKCYSVRIYSLIPTDAEREQNYLVDKMRFNLP